MKDGVIQIYYGEGHGKSTAALGNAIHAASKGKHVTVIQFLKGKNLTETTFLKRLEPEINCFNFSKFDQCFSMLTEEEKEEEIPNLKNGFNYSRKVVTTGSSDLVILDELLGLEDVGVVTFEDIENLLARKPEDTAIIITGRKLDDRFRSLADEIYDITPEK